MATRRSLEFASLDHVMPEVDRLLAGHTTTGNWSLGQICNHLNDSFRFSLDGFGEGAVADSEARGWYVQETDLQDREDA